MATHQLRLVAPVTWNPRICGLAQAQAVVCYDRRGGWNLEARNRSRKDQGAASSQSSRVVTIVGSGGCRRGSRRMMLGVGVC